MVSVFSLGQLFSSWEELSSALERYQQETFTVLSKELSRTIEASQKKCPNKPLNPDLKFYELKYVCHHGGSYKGKNKGIRPNTSTVKTGCPFKLQFRVSGDGQMLQLRDWKLEHNHELNEEAFRHHPKIRKLDDTSLKEAKEMLRVDPNRKLVRQHFADTTGKTLIMRDIHDIALTLKSHDEPSGSSSPVILQRVTEKYPTVKMEVVLEKNTVSENENDIWDDSALIEAYDNAVSVMQEQLSGHGVEIKQNPTKEGKDKGKNNQKRKRKKKPKNKNDRRGEPTSSVQWKAGVNCRAVYTDDGQIYEALIKSIDLTNNTAVVRFLGYGNEEEYELDDLFPSEVVMSRQQRRMSQTSDVFSESDVSMEGQSWQQQHQQPHQQHSRRRGSTGSSRGRGSRGPTPRQHSPGPPPMAGWGTSSHPPPPPMAGWGSSPHPPPPPHPWMGPASINPLQSMFGGAPPLIPPMFASPDFLSSSFPSPMAMPPIPPPPPPILDTDDISNDKEALHNMLISWYMSGYNTGYYQGLKDGKGKVKSTQSEGNSGEHKEQEATARKT